jgi:hypothetical protein
MCNYLYLLYRFLYSSRHGILNPQIEDMGGGNQMWRVAAKTMNKQSWTTVKGWSSGLGVGREAKKL